MKKFLIHNLGCKVNFAEISKIKQKFEENGYTIATEGEAPDYILINTCTVTDKADADGRRLIRKYHKNFPDAKIIPMGCYAEINHKEIFAIDGVYKVLGNIDKFSLLENLENEMNTSEDNYHTDLASAKFHYADSAENEAHTRISMKLQDGCDYYCTYCAIPYSRGRNRSMPFDDFQREFDNIYQKGTKEVILSGINLGCYRDENSGKDFADVIQYIDASGYDMRVRISSIEPNLLTDKIIDIVSNSKVICPHFHIPLQSGSDTILKAMNRKYDTKKFGELFSNIHSKINNCGIGIDVITGFPGESEELFNETYDFIKSLKFSYLHVFSYSDRSIARASQFKDKVDNKAKKERTNRLISLSDERKNLFYQDNIDKIHRIIPENYNEKLKKYTAWTDNYNFVSFISEKSLEKRFYSIKLVNLNGDAILVE